MFFNKAKRATAKKLREVKELLAISAKVINYRADILKQSEVERIFSAEDSVRTLYKNLRNDSSGCSVSELDSACARLRSLLKVNGGRIFNSTFLSENIETILVASILAISIRSFFLQPFRIPTGSMFPSFSGMQTKIYSDEPIPTGLRAAARWVTQGAESYTIKAPCDGAVMIPLFTVSESYKYNSYIRFSVVYGREIFGIWTTSILRKPYRLYTFEVGNESVSIRVPFEFNGMESLITRAFFGRKYSDFSDVISNKNNFAKSARDGKLYLTTNKRVSRGDNVLSFEILTGDMLLVDRMSYNFRSPKVGEPIVFRTKNIPKLNKDLYYIKRLVGSGGDELYINDLGVLFRNGRVVTGSIAFDLNIAKKGLYPGYIQSGNLSRGQKVRVPTKFYYALGDNSPYSGDSRYWDFVPDGDVVGKPVIVLHPFSWRWGKIEKDKSNPSANKDDFTF